LDKNTNKTINYDRIKDRQKPEEFLENVNGSENILGNLQTRKWRLLKTEEQENIKVIESVGTPIGELFNICVGIATLKDEVFFVDGKQKKDNCFVKTTEQGNFEVEEEITKVVYKISDFKNQNELESNTRRIICPYSIRNGTARVYSVEELKEIFPKCFNYFLSEKEKLAARDKGKPQSLSFFAWGRTQGITRIGEKILTPTFSQLPRFLIAEDEEAYFTNGYGVYFKEDKKRLFKNELTNIENIDIIQKILNSFVMNYYVTKTSVSIEGGYPCYQKNFIEKFTIPNFSKKEISQLRNLNESEEIDCFLAKKYKLKLK
jgi:hypothetical protein